MQNYHAYVEVKPIRFESAHRQGIEAFHRRYTRGNVLFFANRFGTQIFVSRDIGRNTLTFNIINRFDDFVVSGENTSAVDELGVEVICLEVRKFAVDQGLQTGILKLILLVTGTFSPNSSLLASSRQFENYRLLGSTLFFSVSFINFTEDHSQ